MNRYSLNLLLGIAGTGRSQTSALIKANQYSHSHLDLNHAIRLCMIGNILLDYVINQDQHKHNDDDNSVLNIAFFHILFNPLLGFPFHPQPSHLEK